MADSNQTINSVLMQRDALMTLLVAQSHGLIQRLALLANSEKTAVAGLMLVSQAMGVYTRDVRPDQEVIKVYERMLASLSPVLAGQSALLSPARMAAPEGRSLSKIDPMTLQLKNLLTVLAQLAGRAEHQVGDSRSLPPLR